MVERTIASARASSSMSVMNDRSILSSLAGSVVRYSIDALPVPKSSIETPTPLALIASSPATARARSSTAALSVTSTVRRAAGIECLCSNSAT